MKMSFHERFPFFSLLLRLKLFRKFLTASDEQAKVDAQQQ